MPYRLEIAGAPPPVDLPSWQDPKFVSEPVGMTPEAIWNQALSEYEARLKKPRTDVWGNTLAEDRPEALDRSIMAPLRAQFGIPEPKSPWSGPIETAGGNVIQVNTLTGDTRVVAAGQPKPTTIHSPQLGVIQVDNAGNVKTVVPPGPQQPKPPAYDPLDIIDYRDANAEYQRAKRAYYGEQDPNKLTALMDAALKAQSARNQLHKRLKPIGAQPTSIQAAGAPTLPFAGTEPAGAAPTPMAPAAAAARSPVLDTSVPTYGSENEARAAGLKAGAVVYLVGVGKVRLE